MFCSITSLRAEALRPGEWCVARRRDRAYRRSSGRRPLLFPGGAALARVPGRGRAALGGGVSGGISLPGPAFPFGLPAAFPVGLFLPAPFLPLPGLPFLLPAAGQFFLACSRSWRCQRSLLRGDCRRRSNR